MIFLTIFSYDSDEEGQWYISPFIFGYAKSFERRNLLMNYNEFPWGGKQTTYFTADGDVIGYGESWDDDWGSGTTYMNADWEYIGSEWDDNWGSGYQFTVQGSESDDFAYNDFGQHTWTNWEGVEETRSFDFKFDQDWNLISGTETMGDGSTITFGANWEIVSETRTVNLESDNIAALTDEQKADITDPLLASSAAP